VPTNRVLIVEPEATLRQQLRTAAETISAVDAEAGVPTARQRLLTIPYSWLVTNIRLHAYNGLHLAYLAKMSQAPIRILVYGDRGDLLLAREAQQLGGFYEPSLSVANVLSRLLTSVLPPADRRDAAGGDRRQLFRGGRRTSDAEPFQNRERPPASGGLQASPVRLVRD
jgi:hypothetical protein